MLGFTKLECSVQEHYLEIVNKIYIYKTNGKISKVNLSSDYFVGYDFEVIVKCFNIINHILNKLDIFIISNDYIVSISSKQHFLVNKRMNNTIIIKTISNKTYSLDISDLFKDYEYDIDLYIKLHDTIFNICNEIERNLK